MNKTAGKFINDVVDHLIIHHLSFTSFLSGILCWTNKNGICSYIYNHYMMNY